jgi:hypothetical protein
LKNTLLQVFSNFDKEIIQTIDKSSTAQGKYKMTSESFDGYVKRKKDQINKIVEDFKGLKNPSTKLVPTNYKVNSVGENQKEKIIIGEI